MLCDDVALYTRRFAYCMRLIYLCCVLVCIVYTHRVDFTGAMMIVDELGDDPATGVTLKTLTSLVPGGLDAGRVASWSGARFGDSYGRATPTASQWHE